jgi:competence protein ComFC
MFFINFLKYLINNLLDLFYKENCLGCSLPKTIICNNCLNQIRPSLEIEHKNIFALYDYKDPLIKKIVWQLKYSHHRRLGKILGKILYNSLLEKISEINEFSKGKKIIILPVPITRKRTILRGYNQSEEIARGFCEENKDIFEINSKIIARKKGFLPQAKIKNRKERFANITGAFYLKNKKVHIRGRTIIIIDDVTTTGATLREIMRLLKNYGAKKVFGFTIAH